MKKITAKELSDAMPVELKQMIAYFQTPEQIKRREKLFTKIKKADNEPDKRNI